LVLEILTSFTKILHYLKDKKYGWNYSTKKNQTDRPILKFFCCHMVSFMLKKVKRGPVALFFLLVKLRGLKNLEKSIYKPAIFNARFWLPILKNQQKKTQFS